MWTAQKGVAFSVVYKLVLCALCAVRCCVHSFPPPLPLNRIPNQSQPQEHITQRLLPVKARMLAQLARQQRQQQQSLPTPLTSAGTASNSPTSTTSTPPSCSLFLGGISGKDDASAVSDGWVVGTPTSTPALSDGGGCGLGSRSGASLTSSGHLSGTTSSASLPRPCSSLSFADLGDLCGDQEGADDACGGVFLVDGDDCDDVNGSGIGLDLYDLGQVLLFVVHIQVSCSRDTCIRADVPYGVI